MTLARMNRYGVPRCVRYAGQIVRLPRGYRKRLKRKAASEMLGLMFKITYDMWDDDVFAAFAQAEMK